jgi:hypothetical protein
MRYQIIFVESVRDDKQKQPNSQQEFGSWERDYWYNKGKELKLLLFQTKLF